MTTQEETDVQAWVQGGVPEEANVHTLNLAELLPQIIARVLPPIVERAVARELAGVQGELEALRGAVYEALENQAFDPLVEALQRSYAEQMARVAAQSGIGMGDFAKILRDTRAQSAEADTGRAEEA